MAENERLYGTITCEQCHGRKGEVSANGKTIFNFEMDHKVNVSSAGVDRERRYRLETDPANHWILCAPCHEIKTKWEAAQGRERKASRSKRKHPGVIY